MTIIDGNADGNPDGIINLYDEYNAIPGVTPITPATGTWFDPGFNFALEVATGDLYLWDLDNSSVNIEDYQFQLINTASGCTDNIITSMNVILGPFSGFAVPTVGTNSVNIEVCDIGIDPCGSMASIDLYSALVSVPSPHINGIWEYEGTSPNFIAIVSNRFFTADIPYQPGFPLVDEETFELVYKVPGIDPCVLEVETRIKVSVVRAVFSGAANYINICETELINGDYDTVDLRDDEFLVNEDVEGIWMSLDDPTGQISGPGDSQINLGEVYDNLYSTNPRFGCALFSYSYFVQSRSTVCTDMTSTVSFTFFEAIRPFQQDAPIPEFCVGDDTLGTLNLYDQLTFTTENGTLYDYPSPDCTNWTLISGPSDLGLVTNTGDLCTTLEDPSYTTLGTINLSNLTNLDAGTYVFEYTVLPEYNCDSNISAPEVTYETPDGCTATEDPSHPCELETAQVTIVINPFNYAGEDTGLLTFCETEVNAPINLIALLETNTIDDPVYEGPLGTWTDLATGNVISNPFTIPQINGQQTFNFNYSTTTDKGCTDSANLSFIVYQQYDAGSGATVAFCDNDNSFNLFDLLTGNPDTNGTWSGPNGYTTTGQNATLNPATAISGDYTYTISANGSCTESQAVVSLTINKLPSAGNDNQETICTSDNSIDLLNLLDAAAAGGIFLDSDSTGALSGSIVDVSQLITGSYDYEYQVTGQAPCGSTSAIITLNVIKAAPPTIANQTFCLIEATTVGDLDVSNASQVIWYESETSTTELSLDTILLNGEDYFAVSIDSNGCESDRVGLTVTLLPLNDDACDLCINDGISVNGDGQNDTLFLCDLPIIFPNYEIKIYNRYGSLVFTGNNNKPPFDGTSNVPLTIGDALPAGVYFYIFDPKDGLNDPFQDNLYLSR